MKTVMKWKACQLFLTVMRKCRPCIVNAQKFIFLLNAGQMFSLALVRIQIRLILWLYYIVFRCKYMTQPLLWTLILIRYMSFVGRLSITVEKECGLETDSYIVMWAKALNIMVIYYMHVYFTVRKAFIIGWTVWRLPVAVHKRALSCLESTVSRICVHSVSGCQTQLYFKSLSSVI